MSAREILTFQLGNYSNYVGAHWWNIQCNWSKRNLDAKKYSRSKSVTPTFSRTGIHREDDKRRKTRQKDVMESSFQYDEELPIHINHDVLFREGKTMKGHVTFTPRLILVDRVENTVNVPYVSEIDDKSSKASVLDGSIKEVHEVTVEKHEFIKDLEKVEKGQKVDFLHKNYNFDETVRTWSDFLRTRYHHRSVCTVPPSLPTDVFYSGRDYYEAVEDELVDKIRCYMEECDNLQGFQIIVDATDGFGGLGNSLLIHLHDEYSRKPIFTVPVLAKNPKELNPLYDIKRTLNIVLCYQKLTENSSLLVPLGTNTKAWSSFGPPTTFPNLIYKNSNLYHTSAILASFLDTATLKYRLREEINSMHDFVSGLNYYNNKVCAATTSLPFPIGSDSYLLDTLENLEDSIPLWSSLTPGCNVTEDKIFYQKITVRGISADRLKSPDFRNNGKNSSRAHLCTSVEELIHMFLSYRLTTISDVTSSPSPLNTVIPYPKIFSPQVSSTGNLHHQSARMNSYEVSSCPMITGLHCCKAVGDMLESLHLTVKRINIKKFHEFFGEHMDSDEFSECLEKLRNMVFGNTPDFEW